MGVRLANPELSSPAKLKLTTLSARRPSVKLAGAERQPSGASGRRIPAIECIVKHAQRLRQDIEIRTFGDRWIRGAGGGI